MVSTSESEANQPPSAPSHGPEGQQRPSNQPLQLLIEAYQWYALVVVLVLLCVWRGLVSGRRHRRQRSIVASLADEQQTAWRGSVPGVSHVKKWLVYAPLWAKRRSKRAGLSGTLPTRLEAVVLAVYFLGNIGFLLNLDWEHSQTRPVRVQLMGRSGSAITANIIPLILMAARNNPLERLLKISHDTHILLHRWIGRMICLQLFVHVTSWTVGRVDDGGWSTVWYKITQSRFIGAGSIGFFSSVFILLLSFQSFRRRSYETFLNLHIFLVCVFLIGGVMHCVSHPPPLPQLWLIVTGLAFWVVERLLRLLWQLYCSWTVSSGLSRAVVRALPGEAKACIVTLELRRCVRVRPGAHAYIRLEAIQPWASHPFSIAWVEQTATGFDSLDSPNSAEKPAGHTREEQGARTRVSFIVGAEQGFTRKLYDKACSSPELLFTTRGTFEGPYGGHNSLNSYGHVVLFAGATGICHQLRYVQCLVAGHRAMTVSARRVMLVWAIRDTETLGWVISWLRSIRCPLGFLEIRVFVTRSGDCVIDNAPYNLPTWVSIKAGRPDVSAILEHEVAHQVGAMGVTVCGPGGLADGVRAAVRAAQDSRHEIDFFEEAFNW